jgi:hypothetical protein
MNWNLFFRLGMISAHTMKHLWKKRISWLLRLANKNIINSLKIMGNINHDYFIKGSI